VTSHQQILSRLRGAGRAAGCQGILAADRGPRLTVPTHRAAFEIISEILTSLEPGAVPALGSARGSDGRPEADLLVSLAMEPRPLADAHDVVRRLEQEVVDRQIAVLKPQLEETDGVADPEAVSERWERLIALEKERRKLRSRE